MTKKTTILRIMPDGSIKCLGGDDFKELEKLGPINKERVSHILPVNSTKRFCFRLLRKLFGETGRVSDWTRSWNGPWEVTILKTNEKFINQNRCDCIEWEKKKLE